jgi:deoxyhypusine synthase
MVKLSCRAIPLPEDNLEDVLEEDEFIRRNSSCTIFLGFTSNMVSAGIRDTIRFLVQHHMVRVLMVMLFQKLQ